MKIHVTIYTRPGCHLCEEAKAAIRDAGSEEHYLLEEVNIESDPELLQRYKNDIPVVTFDGVEFFRHWVGTEAFKKAVLSRLGA